MQKVYGFTNEFVAAYPRLYDFDNADVLSILGSGDQYFTAMLAGAKNVTVCDINKNAWYHFVLKFTAIKYLCYEEFYEMFITNGLDNMRLYLKIREYLPLEVRKFFDVLRITKMKFSFIKINSSFSNSFNRKDYIRMLPFLEESSYYKLQDLLNNTSLPTCIINDFSSVALGNDRKDYDIALLSNIFHWMDLSMEAFKDMLDNFNNCTFQALYAWRFSEELKEFINLGFLVTPVPSVKKMPVDTCNYVLTYKRTK